MPASFSPAAVTDPIQRLLDERQAHVDALASIDQKLEQITGILKGTGAGGRPPAERQEVTKAQPKTPPSGGGKGQGKGNKGGRQGVTAAESVLAFVKERGNPTTEEIRQQWAREKRGGKANNTLTELVKNEKLKREPMEGGVRGSRYSVA